MRSRFWVPTLILLLYLDNHEVLFRGLLWRRWGCRSSGVRSHLGPEWLREVAFHYLLYLNRRPLTGPKDISLGKQNNPIALRQVKSPNNLLRYFNKPPTKTWVSRLPHLNDAPHCSKKDSWLLYLSAPSPIPKACQPIQDTTFCFCFLR